MPNSLAVVDALVLRRTVKKLPVAVAEPAELLGKAATGGALWVGFAGLLSLLGSKGRRAAQAGLTAYGITAAVANGPAKWLTRRKRPRGVLLAGLPRRGHSPATSSFPSSHTAAAVAFAVASSAEFPATAPVVLSAAGAVALSRIRAVRHYPTDVIGGVVFGCVLGGAVVWATRRADRRRKARASNQAGSGI